MYMYIYMYIYTYRGGVRGSLGSINAATTEASSTAT